MMSDFELVSQIQDERAQKQLNEYLSKLNDKDELEEEQKMLSGQCSLIGGRKQNKNTSDF